MYKKLAILAAALFVFTAAFLLKGSEERASAAARDQVSAPRTEAPLPRLVDLGSDKCIPCKKMAPILDELRHEYGETFVVEFIDVWKDPEAGKPFGIRVIPTQVFIDAHGAERYRHEGFIGKEAILAKWEELGVDLTTRTHAEGS
jgi:thioredoxin 1